MERAVCPRPRVKVTATSSSAPTVQVTATPKTKSGYRVWACPIGGDEWKPCTAPVKLTAKPAQLRVKLGKGEKVRVVVARAGKR